MNDITNLHGDTTGLSPVKPHRAQDGVLPRQNSLLHQKGTTLQSRAGLFVVEQEQEVDGCSHAIVCPKSIGLLFGRARGLRELAEANQTEDIASDGSAAISNGIPLKRVALPNTARHVSRDHCVVYHSPFGGSSWAVKILGQNGLLVDGKRHRPGSILRLSPRQSIIDFFGVRCLFVGSEEQETSRPKDFVVSSDLQQDGRSPQKGRKRTVSAHTEDVLRTAVTGVAVIGSAQKRFVGNAVKRPIGAPLSPPTSSPAPLEMASSPVKRALPSSSPAPVRMASLADDEEEEEDEEGLSRSLSPILQRQASKTSKADDSGVLFIDRAGVDSEDEASQILSTSLVQKRKLAPVSGLSSPNANRSDAKRVKFSSASSTPVPASTSKITPISASTMNAVQKHLRSLVSTLAQSYDLQGLLAGAIVFHRTATISATEAVRSVLSSTPGLLRGEVGPEPDASGKVSELGGTVLSGWTYEDFLHLELVRSQDVDKDRVEMWQRKAWRERLEACLMEGECFGIIQRAGKDASGNPLEFWYYYDKERDPDTQRAANLGAFVKPMRAALKSHKPIFWRKSAYGNTTDDVKGVRDGNASSNLTDAQQALATESQWGSSGSTLSAALLTGTTQSASSTAAQKPKAATSKAPTSPVWEETQLEQEQEQTWDREGDQDFDIGTSRKSTAKRSKK